MANIKVNGLKLHVQQLNRKASETIILIPGFMRGKTKCTNKNRGCQRS